MVNITLYKQPLKRVLCKWYYRFTFKFSCTIFSHSYFLKRLFGKPKGYEPTQSVNVKHATTISIIAVVITVVFGLSADLLYPLISEAAQSFYDPSIYIESVLGGRS